METAGFWLRSLAAFVDGLVFFVVQIPFAVLDVDDATTQIVSLVLAAGYFTYFHGRTGQTPGDALAGIRVVGVREDEEGPIGYRRALIRWGFSFVSAFVALLGYFAMLWHPERQTWHDRVAGSVPVRV